MALLHGLLKPFQLWNDTVLPVGRWISIVAIALMVAVSLVLPVPGVGESNACIGEDGRTGR